MDNTHTGIINGIAEELGWECHLVRTDAQSSRGGRVLVGDLGAEQWGTNFFLWKYGKSTPKNMHVGVQIIDSDLVIFYNGSVTVDQGFGNLRKLDLNDPELIELVGKLLDHVVERNLGV